MARCRNCGTELTGRYCARCGQEDAPDPPFGRIVRDLVGDVLNVDSRIWRTLRLLVARPGALSAEYLAGRRARYLSPARLYLVISVVFFTAMATAPVTFVHVSPDESASGVDLEASDVESAIEERLARAASDPDRLNRQFTSALAWTMFALIPVFALLLKGIFRRPGLLYVHHLVFALHYHAFAFLTLAIGVAATHVRWSVGSVPGFAITVFAPQIVNAAYLYLAVRRFYETSAIGALVRLFVLGAAYFMTIAIGLVATLGVVLLLLA